MLPPGIHSLEPDRGLNGQSLLVRDAIVARRLLRVPNRFLYFWPCILADRNEISTLGLTVVGSPAALLKEAASHPNHLSQYEERNIRNRGILAWARFVVHELRSRPDDPFVAQETTACLQSMYDSGVITAEEASARTTEAQLAILQKLLAS